VKKTRRIVQSTVLGLVLASVFIVGANCERWCPFGGVEAVYTYAHEGNMLCSLGTSNFFILGGVLAMTVLLRRAFCGYLCPLGTISEWLHALGRWLRIPSIRVEGRLDRALALLKYPVLAAILIATWKAGELIFRGFDPCYALISRHGPDITSWAYVVAGAIVFASLLMIMPFCRWFCPFAALLNPLSRFGLTRIKRNPNVCHECGLCSKNCPAAIPVDQVEQVKASRCIACLNCVDGCPEQDANSEALVWGPPELLGQRWPQAALITIMLLCTTAAVAASYIFPMPSFIKSHGSPSAQVSKVRLQVADLTCRGRANLFVYFLERDDMYEIPGYFKVEAWPGPGLADVDITYDPTLTSEDAIKQAITEPYYDATADFWRKSPFMIEGYDPWIFQRQIRWSAGP
jgi:polyferredoxin